MYRHLPVAKKFNGKTRRYVNLALKRHLKKRVAEARPGMPGRR